MLGPQGSGKGTQADLLAKKFNLQKIEMGDILRGEAKSNPDVASRLKAGIQFSDEEIFQYMEKYFKTLNKNQGIVLDGFARSIRQAQDVEKALKALKKWKEAKAIYVKISDKEAIARLTKRSICSKCKTLFIGREQKICSKCGGEITVRADDTEEAVKKRLGWFHQNAEPAIEYFKKQGISLEINGEQSIEGVQKEILEKLNI